MGSLTRWSLRTKIIAWFFIPTSIILSGVALANFHAYQDVTEELALERDQELTRLSANQLASGLLEYSDLLTEFARAEEIYSITPEALPNLLRANANRLVVFDGGTLILDSAGTVVASEPQRPAIMGADWSNRAYYRDLIRSQIVGSQVRVFSNVVSDGPNDTEVIVVAVPVTDEQGEYHGAMLGLFHLSAPNISAFYGTIVKLRIGESGNTYLVDGNGRVIYHADGDLIGEDFSNQPVVHQVMDGQYGAIRTEDYEGTDIVAGFAPVPGSQWGLVTQESWAALTTGVLGHQQRLLLLLALGILIPTILVAIGVHRIIDPVKQLMDAAKDVAGGNLGRTIEVKTGDEIQALADQFNTMGRALESSYSELEQRIADRTKELQESEERLRTVITSSPIVLFSLDEEGVFTLSEGKGLGLLGLQPGDVVGMSVFDIYKDTPQIIENVQRALDGESFTATVDVSDLTFETTYSPLKNNDGMVTGVTGVSTDITERERVEEKKRELAVLEERARLARDLHDSVTQSLYSVTLFSEAARRSVGNGDVKSLENLLEPLGETAQQALKEMRLLLFQLRPAELEQEGLHGAIQKRLNTVEERAGITTQLIREGPIDLSKTVERELYRIAQESLNNAIKHASASTVTVRIIGKDSGEVMLDITDNGKGFDPESLGDKSGLGLTSMRERVERLGGQLRVSSSPGNGTVISVSVSQN